MANSDEGDQRQPPHAAPMRHDLIAGEPLTLVGMHSQAPAGVFTHHGHSTYIHVVTRDGSRAGHIDRARFSGEPFVFFPGTSASDP